MAWRQVHIRDFCSLTPEVSFICRIIRELSIITVVPKTQYNKLTGTGGTGGTGAPDQKSESSRRMTSDRLRIALDSAEKSVDRT